MEINDVLYSFSSLVYNALNVKFQVWYFDVQKICNKGNGFVGKKFKAIYSLTCQACQANQIPQAAIIKERYKSDIRHISKIKHYHLTDDI